MRSQSANLWIDRAAEEKVDEKSVNSALVARRAQSERINECGGATSRDTETGTGGIRALCAASCCMDIMVETIT